MEDKFLQQLKKGALEMLVLSAVCDGPTYGYALLGRLQARSDGLFTLKEGTLYPILYRLEDDGFIEAGWTAGEGRTAPKKMYTATDRGREEAARRRAVWKMFVECVENCQEGAE